MVWVMYDLILFSFEGTKICNFKKSGDYSGEDTPVPISNTVVKLLSADDTWWEAAWESRTLPVFYWKKHHIGAFSFCWKRCNISIFRKYAFPDGIGFAARMKSVKLGALVIWTLPVFYYLDLYNRDKKLSTHKQLCAFFYLPQVLKSNDGKAVYAFFSYRWL